MRDTSTIGASPNEVSHSSTTELLRLVKVRWCSCEDFVGAPTNLDDHLLFAKTTVDIARIGAGSVSANAVSYAWGASDRKDYVLGHYSNGVAPVTFTLGSEWSVTRFMARLVELCQTADGMIWIDRICLPQKYDELRKTLMEIPAIYTNLPVKILLPGRYCECLAEAWEAWAKDYSLDGLTQAATRGKVSYERLLSAVEGSRCARSNGASTWGMRVWPFQELYHACNFQVIWTEQTSTHCNANGPYQSDTMPRKHPNTSQKHVGRPSSDQVIQNNAFFTTLRLGLRAKWEERNSFKIVQEADKRTAQDTRALDCLGSVPTGGLVYVGHQSIIVCLLLLGYQMQVTSGPEESKKVVDNSLGTIQDARLLILDMCQRLSDDSRYATESRDYIISVFTNMDKYRIPDDYRRMGVWHLLENALDQLISQPLITDSHGNTGPATQLYIPCRTPGGLLNDVVQRTYRLSANHSLRTTTIQSSRDVFFAFGWTHRSCVSQINIGQHGIPLKFVRPRLHSKPAKLLTHRQWAEENQGDLARTSFLDIMKHWSTSTKTKAIEISHRQNKHSSVSCTTLELYRGWEPDQTNILNMICELLGMDVDLCTQNDIDLVFKRVYFSKRDEHNRGKRRYCVGLLNWCKYSAAMRENYEPFTIGLEVPTEGKHYTPWFESIQTLEKGRLKHHVIGTWSLTFERVIASSIDAFIPKLVCDGPDAWLV